jgi:hypothetical protein
MFKKIILIVLGCYFIIFPFSSRIEAQNAKEKKANCHFEGILKSKIEDSKIITLEFNAIQKEFIFIDENKKECLSWPELIIGDKFKVLCKEKKNRLEATCVQKIPSGSSLSGGSITGGVLR